MDLDPDLTRCADCGKRYRFAGWLRAWYPNPENWRDSLSLCKRCYERRERMPTAAPTVPPGGQEEE